MFTTIGDVKTAGRLLWPLATDFYVTLVNPRHPTSEGYRVTAVAENNRVLDLKTARSHNELKTLLERELAKR